MFHFVCATAVQSQLFSFADSFEFPFEDESLNVQNVNDLLLAIEKFTPLAGIFLMTKSV